MTASGPMFLSDTAININPTAEDLAQIALMTANSYEMFGMEPNLQWFLFQILVLQNESQQKSREAVAYLHKYYPDLIVDGEIQTDFALNRNMLKNKFPFSKFAR